MTGDRPPATTAVTPAKAATGVALFAVAFVVLGLPDFGHGVAWPELRADLDRPVADLGTLLVAQAAGYLVVATGTGRLAARWSLGTVVVGATGASAAGLAAIALAPAWPVAVAGSVVAGFGAGGMDTGFNAAAALRADGRLMGLLHAGYGVGAALGPVSVGISLAAGGGWRPAYAVFALASAVLVPALLRGDLGPPPRAQPSAAAPVRRPIVRDAVLPCATFFVYVALEVTAGQWAYLAFTEHRALGELVAALLVGAYWVALTAGRLWLGLAGHRRRPTRVLAAGAAVATVGAAVLWVGGPLAPAGLPVAGLGLSVVFPLLMLLTPERVGAERAAAVIGWQTAAASVGAAAGPAAAGLVIDAHGPAAYGPVVVALAIAFGAALGALNRR